MKKLIFAIPQHPRYPSGHACASGASGAIMSVLFPNDAALFTSMANDAGTSTFDALIHTQLDVSQGLALGTQVGQKVAARASAERSKLIPESFRPSSETVLPPRQSSVWLG
jgi:hypothetical protein